MTDVQEHAQGTDDAVQGERPAPMPTPGQVVSRRATFTVASAARECQVHQKTIRRKLPTLAEHGAVLEPDGWVIPYDALRAIGLHPGQQTPPDAGVQAAHPGPEVTSRAVAQGGVDGDVQAELDTLRLRLEHVETQLVERDRLLAERAEVVAALRLNVTLLQHQLEAGPTPTPTTGQPSAAETTDVAADASAAHTGGPVIAVEPPGEISGVTTRPSVLERLGFRSRRR